MVTNACATQALLAILMNRDDIDLGPLLSNFKEFTKDVPPEVKGMAIGSSAEIRDIHNQFARFELNS